MSILPTQAISNTLEAILPPVRILSASICPLALILPEAVMCLTDISPSVKLRLPDTFTLPVN